MNGATKDRITDLVGIAAMREFILFSRQGTTAAPFDVSTLGGTSLDIVARCISAAFCVSGHIRRDVTLHIFLGGPPSPPVCLRFDGNSLRSLDPSERGIGEAILGALNSLKGRPAPQGITASRISLEYYIRNYCIGRRMYVLEEGGRDIDQVDLRDAIFILGDKVGLPKKEEIFVERHGAEKLSIGSTRYFSSHCIVILNYELDRREFSKTKGSR